MKRKLMLMVALVMAVGLLSACSEKMPEPPPVEAAPPPPPPPSAEQLRDDAMKTLAGVLIIGSAIPSEVAKAQVNEVMNKLRNEVNGAGALAMVTNQVRDAMREARDTSMWSSVIVLCDVLEVLEPTDSRIDRYREQAQAEMNKPKLDLRVFSINPDTKKVIAAFEVTYTATNETKTIRIQEGEEFENYKFLEVIGDLKGVRLRYIPTSEVVEIML